MKYSDRSIPLFYTSGTEAPYLTVENYPKWYNIFIVHKDGHVSKLEDYDPAILRDIENNCAEGSGCDHVFNPEYVLQCAKRFGFELDSTAFEVIVGRWFIEARNMYNT